MEEFGQWLRGRHSAGSRGLHIYRCVVHLAGIYREAVETPAEMLVTASKTCRRAMHASESIDQNSSLCLQLRTSLTGCASKVSDNDKATLRLMIGLLSLSLFAILTFEINDARHKGA